MSAYKLNEHDDFIAGEKPYSVIFEVPAGNLNKSIQKAISFDCTAYDEIVFSIWSRNEYIDDFYHASDYRYQIEFGGDVYYVPTLTGFRQVVLGAGSETTMDRIKITALHNYEDYLLMSYMVAVKEELPLDIFDAVKSKIEYEITQDSSFVIPVGNVSATVGDASITPTGAEKMKFVQQHVVILIDDGVNSEIHQVETSDGSTITFTSMYDGLNLLNTYTAATAYIHFPVEYGNIKEIPLPGISIWGITPDMVFRGSAIEDLYDTFKTALTIQKRRQGHIFKYSILVDCEAMQYELLNLMSAVVRRFIAKEKLWINGMAFEIVWDGIPTEIEPTDDTEFIPKIQYKFTVEYKEELYPRVIIPIASVTNLTIEPK